MSTVLVIDDDRMVHVLVQNAISDGTKIEVAAARTAQDGLDYVKNHRPDVALLDLRLPDMDGLETFKKLRAIDPKLPVVFVTVDGSSDTIMEAMKLGAMDYILKPLDLDRVREIVRQALEVRRFMHVPVSIRAKDSDNLNGDSLVGRSTQMQEVYKSVGRVAPQDVTVLIRGESGTGKELVARAIYHHSRRSKEAFLAVNCAAVTESLLESELFGHEKGSFTGAASQRIGKFEQCSGGTLFLDEVGDMSPLMQSKVLRVLQEQQFERVGGTQTIRTDARIIAATNRHLEQMVSTGAFREDLYYRLNGYSIRIPPLRDRMDDMLPLLELFFARLQQELGKDVQGISPDALDVLLNYSWPGNIRQLQSVLRQAFVHATGPVLIREFFSTDLKSQLETHDAEADGEARQADLIELIEERLQVGSNNLHEETYQFMERTLLSMVLNRTAGNQSQAAKMLGITRGSLRNKIQAYGIQIDRKIDIHEEEASEPELEPDSVVNES